MKSLTASISNVTSIDRRRSFRWRVDFHVSPKLAPDLARTIVRDLSVDGMMLETEAQLQLGETILVDLPGAEETEALILWRHDHSFGCAFKTPIPSAAISAALLQAPFNDAAGQQGDPEYEEYPIGISPSVEELASWKTDFENSKGREGYRIIAYRQSGNGLMIAIIARADND